MFVARYRNLFIFGLRVDSCGKYNIKYIKKVLTEWQKQGITTLEAFEKAMANQSDKSEEKAKSKPGSKSKNTTEGSIDWSLMDQIINGE